MDIAAVAAVVAVAPVVEVVVDTEAVAVVVVAVTEEIGGTEEIIAAGGNDLIRPGGGRLFSACHSLRLSERSGLEDVVELIRIARRAEVALQSAHGKLLHAAIAHQHVSRVVVNVPLPARGVRFEQGRDSHKLG